MSQNSIALLNLIILIYFSQCIIIYTFLQYNRFLNYNHFKKYSRHHKQRRYSHRKSSVHILPDIDDTSFISQNQHQRKQKRIIVSRLDSADMSSAYRCIGKIQRAPDQPQDHKEDDSQRKLIFLFHYQAVLPFWKGRSYQRSREPEYSSTWRRVLSSGQSRPVPRCRQNSVQTR